MVDLMLQHAPLAQKLVLLADTLRQDALQGAPAVEFGLEFLRPFLDPALQNLVQAPGATLGPDAPGDVAE